MTGQHFKELIETIVKTTGLNKKKLAEFVGVDPHTISSWQRNGVPLRSIHYVRKGLKEALLGGITNER